jgi:Protein of unknown function (DUF4256)
MTLPTQTLSPDQSAALLQVLRTRFEKNMARHAGLSWAPIQARLESMPEKLWSLDEMEATEGEPDVIGQDPATGAYIFCDCAAESPKGRRSICYDQEALDGRKENKPRHSAVAMAAEMGVTLMDEAEYRHLQTLGSFDLKTSSWVNTPYEVRKLGGALFCDRRFGKVFVYHNGAESYYAARAFRGILRV